MKGLGKSNNNLVFSLDIGTRTVIGMLGEYREDGQFNILAYSMKEHSRRNMYDGQIHNIDGVVKLVEEIKEELETKTGTSLKQVYIAAAGRSLETCKVKVEKAIDSTKEIDRRTVELLELEGIQRAQEEINRNGNKYRYYNIDYSVVEYYLEDSVMENLQGHRGEKIGAQLLATFLPQIVIEGLYSVVSKAGLEVANITLEPIAAINVAIKEELRLLNLALVDIGAGTSDIALTKEGNIMAYAMTSTAGDEITEALAKKYLLDFNQAEALKLNLSRSENQDFTNIVGMTYSLSTKEIVEELADTLNKISLDIAEKILEYNGKAPAAVFLIGGSSQMPGLKEILADSIGLARERVSIRDTSFIENVQGLDGQLKGPDIITPIAIGMEGIRRQYKNYLELVFNGEELRLFNTDTAKVSDLLVLTGYSPRKLIPKSGEGFVYYINGRKKRIKGSLGETGQVYVNDKKGDLKTSLKDGDLVTIIEGQKGEKPQPHLYDLIDRERIVEFNQRQVNLITNIKLNGTAPNGNPPIAEGDKIEIDIIEDLFQLMKYLHMDIEVKDILINGQKLNKNIKLNPNDKITTVNKKSIDLLINGQLENIEYKKEQFVFVDIFDFIDFDLSKPQGKLVLKINGQDADYLQELKDKDEIEIYWEK